MTTQGCPYRDATSLPHFTNQLSSKACTCTDFTQPLSLDPVEIMKSNMDSLSTIITFGALIGKVSPVQLIILGMFQSMLYHANRYAVDLLLGKYRTEILYTIPKIIHHKTSQAAWTTWAAPLSLTFLAPCTSSPSLSVLL